MFISQIKRLSRTLYVVKRIQGCYTSKRFFLKITKITNQVSGNYEMKYPVKMNNRVTIVCLYIGYTCSTALT